jgi:lysophospholipase L1-like esterase
MADVVACLGDSLTLSTYSNVPYPQYLENLINNIDPQNCVGMNAVLSSTTATAVTTNSQRILGKPYTHVVILIGVNDVLTSVPAATAMANIDTICNALIAQSKTVILSSVLPCRGYAGVNPMDDTKQTNLEALNVLIAARAGVTYIDGYTHMGQPGNPAFINPIWANADLLHLNEAGAARFGEFIYDEVFSF